MSCVTASTYFAKGSSAFRSLYPARSPNAYLVLSVVDLADEAVAENADVHRGICRRGDGVLATVTLFGRSRFGVLGMMTAAVGQGRAGPGTGRWSADQRGQQPPLGEEADQRPRRVGQPETLAVAQRCPG